MGERRLAAGLLAASAVAAAAHAEDAAITVVISGLRYSDGTVHVDVCTRETFLRGDCPYGATAPARVGETTVTVPNVPPGVYAVQAFHDFNNNMRVDRNALGIPTEGLAFSNDAPLGVSGPSFARAAFTHGDQAQVLRLRLHRFRPPPKTAQPAG